jgi:hypothetical protein
MTARTVVRVKHPFADQVFGRVGRLAHPRRREGDP